MGIKGEDAEIANCKTSCQDVYLYSIGVIVDNTVITVYDIRWVLDLPG